MAGRPVTGRPPRRPGRVRRPRAAARRRRDHPSAHPLPGASHRLGGNGFRRPGQQGGGRRGAARGSVGRGGRARARPGRDGRLGLRRSGLRDGLRVARGAAAGIRLHPPRGHTRPGDARPGPAGRATCQAAQQFSRPTGFPAGSGGHPGELRRRRGGLADAVRVRVDRHGFSAPIARRGRRRRVDPGAHPADLVAAGRAVRFGVPAPRRSRAAAGLSGAEPAPENGSG
ncbi:hypothetical protein D522_06023 [Mycobacterium avium subsp. paratuberculosis S5]|uniref:Uncharacterized protein n=1 Tax=Mycolicibacterium paratuberculosis (strain ATCC BAA-968 / K-10) TaxID=262316 RepID=Q73XL6_MYCPA|nr:hypothetical protein MAP_2293c [Mycobacterium avium subsp. paratuberculosis K-10]ELP47398.1 hypothetical protein D522_06023 [Mycobacterium avium subsp. paratuberculosis S5]